MEAIYSPRRIKQAIREGSLTISSGVFILLCLIALFSFSLFIYQSLTHFEDVTPVFIDGLTGLGLLSVVILLYYLLRIVISRILGVLFLSYDATKKYLINSYLLDINLGLVLLPVVLISTFHPYTIVFYIGLFIIILGYVYKIMRSVLLGLTHTNFSMLYIFLYLCTVEIIPVILFIKLAMKYANVS